MRTREPIVACVIGAAILGSAGAAGTEDAPGILDGIDQIGVRMDYLSEAVSEAGLKDYDLLLELSNPLRDAGLLVLSATPEETSDPVLVLTLESVELPTGDLALHAALELREPVAPARLPGVLALGSTWYSSILTASPRSNVVQESRAIVSSLARQFLGDRFPASAP